MPKGSKILSFCMMKDRPVIFSLVDPSAPSETRLFRCVTTYESFNDRGLRFIGTATGNEWFSMHLFEIVDSRFDPIDENFTSYFEEYQRDLKVIERISSL